METAVPAPSASQPATGRLVAASLIGLVALGLAAAAVAGLVSSPHGRILSGSHPYASGGRAITSGSLDTDGFPDWLVAKARVTASSAGNEPIFVGVGRRADVDRYLAGVARTTIEDVNFDPFAVD